MSTQEKSPAKLITRREATARYAVCLRHLDGLVEAGVIPVVRLGKRAIRIPVEQADRAIDRLITGGGK